MNLEKVIESELEDYIFNVSEEVYIDYLIQNVILEFFIIEWDDIFVNSYEKIVFELGDYIFYRGEMVVIKCQVF